ncbi:MAG TPA: alginate export family protein, partial [Longimicrobiales bacterium]|nr:alginate export family protein [Longimicrobiales bacterium]
MNRLLVGVAASTALLAGALDTGAQTVELGGQVRPRLEFRSPQLDPDPATVFTSMRTRLWLSAVLQEDVSALVQIQDVRLWGEETSTIDASADALDFHQAWVELGNPAAGARALRVGRQELAYGEERLLGALDWVQGARAFDGARLRTRHGDLALDGFAMRLREDEVYPSDASFLGLYGTLPMAGLLDLYALYNTEGDDVTDQYTLGGRWVGVPGPLSWRIEAARQVGVRQGLDVAAYLLAVRLGFSLGAVGGAELWYDRLSGDDDPLDDEVRVFDTLFATNHKFYGYMDLFTNI